MTDAGVPLESAITILLADDLDVWRLKIREMLQTDTRWQVIHEASDGEQAVQFATISQPNVAILDIGMPALNGFEAAKLIRKASPRTKVIFLTQYVNTDFVNQARALGAHGYVLKTHVRSQLLPTIASALALQDGFHEPVTPPA